ncbi:MAG: TIGR00730 family Rossman fold protein [Acidimicrobiales bacterium]
MPTIDRLCVYCASSPGSNPAVTAATEALGQLLAERDIELVYGGGAVGLMGLVADTVLAGGGRVTGIIPTGLFSREVAHRGVTELIEVDSMHERKMAMFERSDAFMALPGGFGTLEEVAEVTTWSQIGIHTKPIGLLNVDGFWDGLITWLDRAVDDRVLREENRGLLVVGDDPADLLATLEATEVTHTEKWLDLDQT